MSMHNGEKQKPFRTVSLREKLNIQPSELQPEDELASVEEVLAAHPEVTFTAQEVQALVAEGHIGGVFTGEEWLTSLSHIRQYTQSQMTTEKVTESYEREVVSRLLMVIAGILMASSKTEEFVTVSGTCLMIYGLIGPEGKSIFKDTPFARHTKSKIEEIEAWSKANMLPVKHLDDDDNQEPWHNEID